MQYFLEGESKCNSKKVINNKRKKKPTVSSEASTPKSREHVPFSAFCGAFLILFVCQHLQSA